MKGLNPVNTLVKLVNGVHTSIRRLLLSMPAQGTTTGKLFVQVERQLASEWLLCCYHTQDASKVTARLATLDDSLKRVTHPDSHHHLFQSPVGLSFNDQVAPLIKGRNKLTRLNVSEPTAAYVQQSLQRIYTPTTK